MRRSRKRGLSVEKVLGHKSFLAALGDANDNVRPSEKGVARKVGGPVMQAPCARDLDPK